MQGVDKMDTEVNCQEGKTGNYFCRSGLMEGEKIMVLDRGGEQVVNINLEDQGGRMRLKRMWKLLPQVGKKRNK